MSGGLWAWAWAWAVELRNVVWFIFFPVRGLPMSSRLVLVVWLGGFAGCAASPASAQMRASAVVPTGAPTLAYRLPGDTLVADVVRRDAWRAARADSLRPPDDWLGYDKALHFGASFLLTLSSQYVLVDKADMTDGAALPLSAGAALALGLAKEVADSRRAVGPHFSLRDLAADALGVAVGALVTRL